jgi:hypothetical protein
MFQFAQEVFWVLSRVVSYLIIQMPGQNAVMISQRIRLTHVFMVVSGNGAAFQLGWERPRVYNTTRRASGAFWSDCNLGNTGYISTVESIGI